MQKNVLIVWVLAFAVCLAGCSLNGPNSDARTNLQDNDSLLSETITKTEESGTAMGKQINYWMEHDSFCELARFAVSLGCVIVKNDLHTGKVVSSRDISMITSDCYRYYFYNPSAGPLNIKRNGETEQVNYPFNETGNAVIEAGYSRINDKLRQIVRGRLYLSTGYYNENEEFIYCPDFMVKPYRKLVRKVKELSPYTEWIDASNGTARTQHGYLSPFCLQLRTEKDYSLSQF